MLKALAVVFAIGLAAASLARAEPPQNLDAEVADMMRQDGVPGLALTVVEHGRVTLAKGYGQRRLGGHEPVDQDTLFEIGSATKAFTGMALGILVDEGKLHWDDKVADLLPGFQMYDPWVTRELTVRDLLTHRSGLASGEGDLMFFPHTDYSPDDIVHAVRFLKPEKSFRSSFDYQNQMYIVAGVVIERVSGQKYVDFMRQHIFTPLGMNSTIDVGAERPTHVNRAQGHHRVGSPTGMPYDRLGDQAVVDERYEIGPNVDAAGGIMSSASDMGRWIAAQLARGVGPGGARVWSEAAAEEAWAPVTTLGTRAANGPLAATTPQAAAYAIGWYRLIYHGHRVIWHAGGSVGFRSIVVLLPDDDVGFAILQNSVDSMLNPLRFILTDYYLGLPKADWRGRFERARVETISSELAAAAAHKPVPAGVGPRLALSAYAGAYAGPWYGPVMVKRDAGGLEIDFTHTAGMRGRLTPLSGDLFQVRWDNPTIPECFVSFATTADGVATAMTVNAISPAADMDFGEMFKALDLSRVQLTGGSQ